MSLARTIGKDVVAALLVLALIFLSFGHNAPQASTLHQSVQLSAQSFCGDPADPTGSDHSPCHACRAGVIVLPAAPCQFEPAFTTAFAVIYPPATRASIEATIRTAHSPRAPPATV